jgi:hypothetical protein
MEIQAVFRLQKGCLIYQQLRQIPEKISAAFKNAIFKVGNMFTCITKCLVTSGSDPARKNFVSSVEYEFVRFFMSAGNEEYLMGTGHLLPVLHFYNS